MNDTELALEIVARGFGTQCEGDSSFFFRDGGDYQNAYDFVRKGAIAMDVLDEYCRRIGHWRDAEDADWDEYAEPPESLARAVIEWCCIELR